MRNVKAFVPSGTPKTSGTHRGCLWLLVAVLLSVAASPIFAATQHAEIGKFTASGTITLQLAKFQEQFADGTKIAEITVTDYNGNRVVKRKGYSASGDCRVEMAPIANSAGQVIQNASVAPAGTRVYLFSVHPVAVLSCQDDGCHALKNVVLLGDPPLQSAKCDVTALSDNLCWCHLNDGTGDHLVNNFGDFCNSFLETILSPLSDWIRLQNIQEGAP